MKKRSSHAYLPAHKLTSLCLDGNPHVVISCCSWPRTVSFKYILYFLFPELHGDIPFSARLFILPLFLSKLRLLELIHLPTPIAENVSPLKFSWFFQPSHLAFCELVVPLLFLSLGHAIIFQICHLCLALLHLWRNFHKWCHVYVGDTVWAWSQVDLPIGIFSTAEGPYEWTENRKAPAKGIATGPRNLYAMVSTTPQRPHLTLRTSLQDPPQRKSCNRNPQIAEI